MSVLSNLRLRRSSSLTATLTPSSRRATLASGVVHHERNASRVLMMPLPCCHESNAETSRPISRATHHRYRRLSSLRILAGLTVSRFGYAARSLRVNSRHSRYMRYGSSYLTFQKKASPGAPPLRCPRTTKPSTGDTLPSGPSMPPSAWTRSQYVWTAGTEGKTLNEVAIMPQARANEATSTEGSVLRTGSLTLRP